ncbi:hypothetical protein [Acidithiobacillus concretivorus]|uniref:Uncharacterized protein n=1 Tax=Acidithiobacillus concretivorus TaxID=3063952 RepID=A0ABS5ZP07_9PROT|nr:hypothetical protein [Acidithiobacillus concretivorus]MBU2737729.1 hypothetical protein [Acidithiobacillus concretivorus]
MNRMAKSSEHARRGFRLILEKRKHNFDDLFDALAEKGFFNPEENPAPEKVDDEGHFRVPYWDALDYLVAVAKKSGEDNNSDLGEKVMNVVRDVSQTRDEDGSLRDNYYTYHRFATILRLVPLSVVSEEDLDLIPNWLQGRFERGLVGHELGQGVFLRMLSDEQPENWRKAYRILYHCTTVRWIDTPGFSGSREEPITLIEDHWLKGMISAGATVLGEKVGRDACDLFVERLCEIFDPERRGVPSWILRPAIEENSQNRSWRAAENRFVEGLRDTLLGWLDHDQANAHDFIQKMLCANSKVVQRIGVYMVNQGWDRLNDLCPSVLAPTFFNFECLHETYGLLKKHFKDFAEYKEQTILVIRQLLPVPGCDDANRYLISRQRDWLSAVSGQGYEPADSWYSELNSDASLGPVSEHPDFNSYHELAMGPGSTPYQADELVAFANAGNIVEKLNGFRQPDTWRGPTIQALIHALESAVGSRPEVFLPLLPKFLSADWPYQYGIINGFKLFWAASTVNQRINWDMAWEHLIGFFESVIAAPEFWSETMPKDQGPMYLLTPNKDWIPTVIADFLGAGTQNDAKAYPTSLLPRGWALIKILLEHATPVDTVADDPMTQALNTEKGRVIGVLYNHALRVCRVRDSEIDSHDEAWREMQPIFDAELAKCKNGNYEFSTLTASFAINIEYLAPHWLRARIAEIFPVKYRNNFLCALEGLAYAQMTPWMYTQLKDCDVLTVALHAELKVRHARENILHWMALAYLWGNETLDSSQFAYLFESKQIQDLREISRFFWSVRGQNLTKEQTDRILTFWDRCIDLTHDGNEPASEFLSSLGLLSCYLGGIGEREERLLLVVAPFVYVDYNADFFVEELDRLADGNPGKVSKVLLELLKTYNPVLDFQDHFKSIIRKFTQAGLFNDARTVADKLRRIPGIEDLWNEIDVSASRSNS